MSTLLVFSKYRESPIYFNSIIHQCKLYLAEPSTKMLIRKKEWRGLVQTWAAYVNHLVLPPYLSTSSWHVNNFQRHAGVIIQMNKNTLLASPWIQVFLDNQEKLFLTFIWNLMLSHCMFSKSVVFLFNISLSLHLFRGIQLGKMRIFLNNATKGFQAEAAISKNILIFSHLCSIR